MTPPPRKTRTPSFDGYVRVSRTQGRSGDSFISPAVQRDTIDRLAAAKGVVLGEVVEELDVSGAKAAKDRELGRLIQKVEAGDSGGLVVWKVSRISRSVADGALVAKRIRDAGGRIIAEDLDTGQTTGKLLLALLLAFAEDELDARRAGWREAQMRAAARGVYPSRPPLGYLKDENGVLTPDPDSAPAIAEAFHMRAQGESIRRCQTMLKERGVAVGATTMAEVMRNPVYLGRIEHGVSGTEDYIYQEGTHPALTNLMTWQAAQRRGPSPVRNGRVGGRGVLLGIITCAGCGRKLTVTGSGSGERRTLSYVCRRGRKMGRGQECPAPAGGYVHEIDALVAEGIAARGTGRRDFGVYFEAVKDLDVAHQTAVEELEDFLEGASITVLGADMYNREVARRRSLVDEAWDRFDEAHTHGMALLKLGEVTGIEHERALAREALASVVLSKATGHGRWGPRVHERIAITWKEG